MRLPVLPRIYELALRDSAIADFIAIHPHANCQLDSCAIDRNPDLLTTRFQIQPVLEFADGSIGDGDHITLSFRVSDPSSSPSTTVISQSIVS
jgi:hypothetical protein